MKGLGGVRRVAGAALSVVAAALVAAWAVGLATAEMAPVVGLAGAGGVITFAVAVSVPMPGRLSRTVATGLVLVGTAVVVSSMGVSAPARTGFLTISGAVLFCAAELADSSSARRRKTEHRPGVQSWDAAWVLGVAAGSAGISYAAFSARGVVAGGGPAALAAGVAGAVLVAFLVLLLLKTRPRAGR
jgi:hypothetical protein